MNDTMEQKILVGIVTLNRKAKLTKTLAKCSKMGFNEIVVVDNGSTDGTREFLQDQKKIYKIFTDKNEGGSGGFNRIMHHFLDAKHFEWLLLFDDDAYPTFSFEALNNFLTSQNDAGFPAYAFKVTYPDGSLCKMNRPSWNVLAKNPLCRIPRDHHIQESTGKCLVDCSSFVGTLLKRSTVEKTGCVSKKFFIYSDDIYYTLSISSRLGKLCYYPDLA